MKSSLITLILCVVFYSFCSAQPCNISNNTISATSSSICTGSSAQINGSTPTGAAIFTYAWLQSSAGLAGPYTAISGQTGISLNIGPLTANRWYKRIVSITCAPTGSDIDTSAALAIVVNPNNTTSLTSAAGTNSQTRCINTALTNITYATTSATGIGTQTGLPSGITAAWSNNTITISGTPTASGIFNYSIPLTGGCGSVNATGVITVTAVNTAGPPSSNPTLCINTPLTTITHPTTGATGIGTPTGLPSGVTAAWANNTITISGSPNASGNFNYSIPLVGGCGSVNATGTITVQALPTVNVGNTTPAICQGATTIALGGSFGGSASGASWSIQTPANGSITSPNNPNNATFTAASNAPASVTLVLTSSGGVCAPVTAPKTITVNPNPVIANLTSNPCSGSPFEITPPTGGSNIIPNGTTYSWPVPSQLNGLSGATAQTGQSSITQTLTNPTNSNVSTTYTVTATASGCTGTFNAAITINPKPFIANSNPLPICSGNSFGPIAPVNGNGNIVPTGTTYTWSISPNSNLTGATAQSGTGLNNISQTINNTSNLQQQITYTITPATSQCTGANFTATITVNPKPFVNNQTVEICSGNSFSINPTNSNGNIIPANTQYSWSSPVNLNVTGLGSGNNVNSISGALTNLIYQNQSAVYQVTPSTTLCTGSPFNLTVNILKKPNIIAIEDQQICQGSSSQLYAADLFGNTNLLYNWSTSPDVGSLNFAYIANPIASPQNTATYIVTVFDPVNSQCSSIDTVIVDVVPLPTISVTSNTNEICAGESVNLSSNGVSASWYLGQTLLSSSATSIIVSPSSNSIYRAFISNGICSIEDQIEITVNSTPNANSGEDFIACSGGAIQLYGSGGDQFNWNAPALEFNDVNQANPIIIDPTEGTYSIELTVSNNNGCSDLDTLILTIVEAPIVVLGIDQNICQGSVVSLQANVNTTNLSYTWEPANALSSISGNTASINTEIVGNYAINVTAVNSYGCSSTDGINVNISPTPVPNILGNLTVCENSYWQEYSVNSSDEHGYQWQITNGEVMSGQGTRNVIVHWFNGTEGELSVREVIWETGCDAITDFTVGLNGIAPDMVAVTQLAAGSNVLVCEDSTFSTYNWGYESKSNPGALFLNVHTQYCNFDLLDPTNYYYFVEHGNDENCLTRSYFNAPPVVSSIDDELDPQYDKLICWPNPAQNSITIGNIKSPTASNRLNVYNALGALIEVENFPTSNEYLLDVSQLMPGLYFIEIVNNTSSKRISFVKL